MRSEPISGVYCIRSKINNDCYIGSSKNIKKRWGNHKYSLKKNNNHARKLQEAWNEYGEDNFEFFIIELCKECDLIQKEQLYLDELKPSYNICTKADSSRGIKKPLESIVRQMLNNPQRHQLGKDNKSSKQIYQYDLDGNFLKLWYGTGEITRELGFFSGNIIAMCRKRPWANRMPYGFFWSYEFLGEKTESIKIRKRKSTSKRLGFFDDKNNMIKEFKSQKEAYLFFGEVTNSKINDALRLGREYHGYKLKYL